MYFYDCLNDIKYFLAYNFQEFGEKMEYKKTIILLALVVFLLSIAGVSASEIRDTIASENANTIELSTDNDIIEDNLQTSEENDELTLTDNDVLGVDSATYSDLDSEIRASGNVTLTHKNYIYDEGAPDIIISEDNKVIDGNGAVIDMTGSTIQAFTVFAYGVTIKNLTIKNANYNEDGGAIYFDSTGTVTNCNFVHNTANCGGAVYFLNEGTVTNCIFTNNTADQGGAIRMGSGTVTNCIFTNNKATGTYSLGGAVFFSSNGEVRNCNFADNSANQGGAIYSNDWYTAADNCIFKRNSGDNVNVVIYPPTLNVDNFTTFYGSGEKLTFNLTTNRGIPVNNGNISISVYFKDNNCWVGNYSCLSGKGWTISLPVGSYYANFTTEYAGFQAISRTIKIIPNIPYYVNVTPVTTNNMTVNITAKSNIPQDIMEGKLLFILPNSTQINANYAGNGTWWAVHTFDDYAVYQVNASYDGLNNVTVSNGTISITRADSTITIDKTVFDYGDSINVATVGAVGIIAMINGADVDVVNNFTIPLSDLNAGTYTLTVTTIADNDHNAVTKNVTITVNKLKTQLAGSVVTATYNVGKYLVITLKDSKSNPLSGVKVSVALSSAKTYTTDKKGQIMVSTKGLAPKTYTAKITFNGNTNYVQSAKNIKVTVKKATPKLTAKNKKFKKSAKVKKYTVTLKTNTKKVMKNVKVTLKIKGKKAITVKTNAKGKATFKIKKFAKKGTYKATVTFKGNKYYNKATKKVKITIK